MRGEQRRVLHQVHCESFKRPSVKVVILFRIAGLDIPFQEPVLDYQIPANTG